MCEINLTDVALLVGSLLAVRDVWFKGRLEPFVSWKAYAETLSGRIGYMLNCQVCVTYHMAVLLLLLYFLPATLGLEAHKVLFLWLAVVGVSNRLGLAKESTI